MHAVRLTDEQDLDPTHRHQAAQLLAAQWGDDWLPDAHAGPHAPHFRALAIDPEGDVSAHLSVFAIPTRPPSTLYGIGDLIVRPNHRGAGLASAICSAAIEECHRRGADTILVDTLAARSIFERLGFEPVTTFRFFYLEGNACARREHWMALQRRRTETAIPDTPVELLEHGDF